MAGAVIKAHYSINGAGCACEDAHYRAPHGRCKHVLATLLARKALALMQAPQEYVLQSCRVGNSVRPEEEPHVLAPGPTPPLPEAPASVNVHLHIAGRQVQLTLRDSDETRLLVRLQAVLARFPLSQEPAPAASQGEGFCVVHQVQMTLNEKHGRSWWSHKTAEGWCKGR